MKILFVCNFPDDDSKPLGGVESVISSLMYAIKNDVSENRYYFFRTVNSSRKPGIYEEGNMSFIYPGSTGFLSSIFRSGKQIREIVRSQDIDIVNFIGSGPMLLKMPLNPGAPVVVTQHGIVEKEMKLVPGAAKLKFLFKSLVDRVYLPLFRRRIFISEFIRSRVRSRLEVSTVIPNPVYVPPANIFLVGTGLKVAGQIIVSGNVSFLKNQLAAIKAVKQLLTDPADLMLLIAGNTKDQGYSLQIDQYLDRNPMLKSHVRFLRGLSRMDALKATAASEILIVTSLHEHLPMVIAEAMLLNTLVVAPAIGAIPEMISNRQSGFLYPAGDVNALANVLRMVLSNRQLWPDILSKASKDATENYSPDRVLGRMHSFFKKVVDESKK